jgi:hypothetical protein
VPAILLTSVDIDAEVRRATEPAAGLLAKTGLTRQHLISMMGALSAAAGEAWTGGQA